MLAPIAATACAVVARPEVRRQSFDLPRSGALASIAGVGGLGVDRTESLQARRPIGD